MWTLGEIAKHVSGVVQGDELFQVAKVATLQNADSDQISFLSNKKYKKYLAESGAGAVIVGSDMAPFVVNHAIVVDDPYIAYAKAASLLNPTEIKQAGIHSSAVVDSNAEIHKTAVIGANVVIGSGVNIAENVVIGAGCVLLDNVIVQDSARLTANITLCSGVKVGKRALIHPGCVIGADGFGIANDKGKWIKVPQVGSVQ
ncbi:MAG: UDP-3-O-(3-hydroxymyristoyl)glucosamine N-acyltransferase, partial [Methylophaga sp.]|nr:UDP-3-O-(3-hydroxymyristoyl)glucosamine N-acyltransferase [Methylophaga sp.]